MRANFGEFRKFWSISTSKFWKKSCDGCTPILGPISYNFDFRILSRSQSYDKPPWRNFDFLSNFDFGENRKFEIFNPSSNPNFLVLNPKPKFAILANFGSLLNLVLPNLDRSRRQLSKNTKIVKFGQNLVPKFLISQILWVLG